MRVAVLSDIHGFDLALKTVLADIDRRGSFDDIVVAGDLCAIGPGPATVVDLIRERELSTIMGNTDYMIVEASARNYGDAEISFAIDKLGAERIGFLESLPFSIRISPPGGRPALDDLLVVHATPHSLIDRFDPEFSDKELTEVKGPTDAAAIAFGHLHICFTRQTEDTLFVDVAAVGNPKDGDLRSKYGILEWEPNTGKWTAEIQYLDYPIEETEAQILAADVPNSKKVIKRLKRAAYKN